MKKEISSKIIAGVMDVPHSKIIGYIWENIEEFPLCAIEFKWVRDEFLISKNGMELLMNSHFTQTGVYDLIELAQGLE